MIKRFKLGLKIKLLLYKVLLKTK